MCVRAYVRRYWYVQNTTRGAVAHASDNGNVFLGGALEDGFLKASNRDQLEFALMWANQDWVDVRASSTCCTRAHAPTHVRLPQPPPTGGGENARRRRRGESQPLTSPQKKETHIAWWR
jgi:hypothetical protein